MGSGLTVTEGGIGMCVAAGIVGSTALWRLLAVTDSCVSA